MTTISSSIGSSTGSSTGSDGSSGGSSSGSSSTGSPPPLGHGPQSPKHERHDSPGSHIPLPQRGSLVK